MSKITKKVASVGLSFITAVSLSGATSVPIAFAQNQSIADLQAQLALIASQLQALQAQLGGQGGGAGVSSAPACNFTRDLTVGSRGDDVKCLQQWLNANGYQVAATGPGSPGNESTYFGQLTKAAVAKWQAAKGISPAAGYFGSKSRAAFAAMPSGPVSGGTQPAPSLPTSSYLQVSVVGPAAGTIPSGSLYNPVLKLRFSAGKDPVSVSSVTVTRGGFMANTNITGVSAWDDEGNRYGNIVTALTSDGKAILSFGASPFVVPAGSSKVMTIAANIISGNISGSLSFSVASAADINAGGLTAQGAFPLQGPTLTVVDGSSSLADIRVSNVAVAGTNSTNAQSGTYTGNVEIGDKDREVFKLRLNQNNSKEAVQLHRVVLYVAGNIVESTDVTNWRLYSPEGNVLATAQRPYDRYVTFNLATPYPIDKGLSKDFVVKADISDGSGRYFTVYVQNDYDILVKGATTGAGIAISGGSGGSYSVSDTQNSPSTAYFKMKSGSLTVAKSASSPSGTNLAPSSQNVVLAEYDLKASGEKLEIRKLGVQVYYSGVALTSSLTVKDKATGETYLSISADTTGLSTTTTPNANSLLAFQRDLSSYITLESGQTKTIQVLGTVSANATSSSNYTVYVGQFYAKRFSTNDFATLVASANPANTLAVGDVGLTIVKNTSFPNTNRVAGAPNVKVAEFVFQASAADDIRVTGITLDVTTSSNFQNLRIMDGSAPFGSTIGTPSDTGNTFSGTLDIAKNQTKTLAVYADILSSATTTSVVSVAQDGVTGYGITSGKPLSSTPSPAVAGQTITIATPTLQIARDSAAPASRVALAGTSGVELNRIRFTPSADAMTLKKLTLQLVSASTTQWNSTSTIAANLGTVSLCTTGGSCVSANVVSGDSSADVVFSGLNFSLPQDADTVLVVKANINSQDTITPRSVFGVQIKSTSTTDMEVDKSSGGQLSAGSISGSLAASNFFLAHAAAPSVANSYTSQQNGTIGSEQEVGRFVFTNNGTREITIASTTFAVALSGSGNSSVTSFKLAAADDESTKFTASGSVSTSTPTADITFNLTSNNTISAGQSRTYKVYADTSSIRSGVTSGDVFLTVSLAGAKGYAAGNATTEKEWADSTITYSYSTTGTNAQTVSNNSASDSVPVTGVAFKF
jgi:hypothetical protein